MPTRSVGTLVAARTRCMRCLETLAISARSETESTAAILLMAASGPGAQRHVGAAGEARAALALAVGTERLRVAGGRFAVHALEELAQARVSAVEQALLLEPFLEWRSRLRAVVGAHQRGGGQRQRAE